LLFTNAAKVLIHSAKNDNMHMNSHAAHLRIGEG